MVPLLLRYSRRSGACAEHCINTRRLFLPVVWVVGSVPVRNVFCNLPHNHANHDNVPAGYAMFEMGSCPACRSCESHGNRDENGPNPSGTWAV